MDSFSARVFAGAQIKLSWLKCHSRAGIRKRVLLLFGIQMVSCTGPPALGDKWQNSTFHPLPSLYLSAVHIPPESASGSTVGRMDEGNAGEGFISEHSAQPPVRPGRRLRVRSILAGGNSLLVRRPTNCSQQILLAAAKVWL